MEPTPTWTSNATVNMTSWTNVTKLTVQGAGTANTIIALSGNLGFLFTLVSTKTLIVKDFAIKTGAVTSTVLNSMIQIAGTSADLTPNFRITNILFDDMQLSGIVTNGYPLYGVIDNCVFNSNHENGNISAVVFYATPAQGNASWTTARSLGSFNAVFIENCTLTFKVSANNAATDSYNGTRFVIRYNNINGSSIGIHGYDSGPVSTHSWEILNNAFSYTLGGNWFAAAYPRGGSGVFANNTTVNYGNLLVLTNFRSCTAVWGTRCGANAPEDGNANPPNNGWPCYQQVGRSSPDGLTSAPVYAWGNTSNLGSLPDVVVQENCAAELTHIMTNRTSPAIQDYYSEVIKPGYSQPTCPHPLTGLTGTCGAGAGTAYYNLPGDTTPPSAPTGVVVQ